MIFQQQTKQNACSGSGPPAEAHEAVSGSPSSSWASANLMKFGFLNARGNNGTREGFYMKTSPVTPSFCCFNKILLLRGNVRKNIKQFYGRKFASPANCCFSKFTRNRLRNLFSKLLCISLFSCQKLWINKKMRSPVIFLVISDKIGSGKSCCNVAMVTANDKITDVLGQI